MTSSPSTGSSSSNNKHCCCNSGFHGGGSKNSGIASNSVFNSKVLPRSKKKSLVNDAFLFATAFRVNFSNWKKNRKNCKSKQCADDKFLCINHYDDDDTENKEVILIFLNYL